MTDARLRAALAQARTFIEYARHELVPGRVAVSGQFPGQGDADAVLAEIEAALAPPVAPDAGSGVALETEREIAVKFFNSLRGSLSRDQSVAMLTEVLAAASRERDEWRAACLGERTTRLITEDNLTTAEAKLATIERETLERAVKALQERARWHGAIIDIDVKRKAQQDETFGCIDAIRALSTAGPA